MFPSDSSLETKFTFETESRALPEEPPFHILLLGNWSGREKGVLPEVFQTKPVVIDRDNFDDILSKFNVGLDLDLESDGVKTLSLQFKELDDFHPDRLFQQIPLFSHMRDLRRRLLNENTFEEAAGEVRSWFGPEQNIEASDTVESGDRGEIPEPPPENLLESILSQPSSDAPGKRRQSIHSKELSEFLSKIVKSHVVKTDENEQTRLLKIVDEATGDLMRTILHHPKFKELEAAWRGIYLLIKKVETDVDLKIFLLDLSRDELISDLKSVSNLADSEIYKRLVKETIETPGGDPWAVVCGNYSFGVNIDDVAALIRISKLSQSAGAPFISHISPELFGFSSLADAPGSSDWKIKEDSVEGKLWSALRTLPESNFLGLSMPRFLARLPYGHRTDPTEAFSFEEFKENTEHDNYLWSNPSFICALLLAQTFRKYSWDMSQSFQLSISDLPTHIYQEHGETLTKPCAEILMTDNVCRNLLEEGLMPLISYKNSDRVQLGRFQSVSLPLKALGGRWK